MTDSALPDVTLGDDEPAMSRVMLGIAIVGVLAAMMLHSTLPRTGASCLR